MYVFPPPLLPPHPPQTKPPFALLSLSLSLMLKQARKNQRNQKKQRPRNPAFFARTTRRVHSRPRPGKRGLRDVPGLSGHLRAAAERAAPAAGGRKRGERRGLRRGARGRARRGIRAVHGRAGRARHHAGPPAQGGGAAAAGPGPPGRVRQGRDAGRDGGAAEGHDPRGERRGRGRQGGAEG